ncbi:pro-opiomelanocortin-like [Brachionichthys hirsutus]|uniref:pro-opiomelanocortin-like n=1 Tax=Brachionichthys hirsutus TaxID=412623 RepID=UPI003604A992
MEIQSTLFVVAMAHLFAPGFGCSDGSICNDKSQKRRLLDSVHFRKSVIQTELPAPGALSVKVMDDDTLLLSIIFIKRVPANKISESILEGQNNQRRSYGHFHWGKHEGREPRPVKVFAAARGGWGTVDGVPPPQARRRPNRHEAKEGPNGESHPKQGLLAARVSSKSNVQPSPHQRRRGTYEMRHFRWGRPSVFKHNGNVMRASTQRKQRQMAKQSNKSKAKDLQRITGRMDKEEEAGRVIEKV